MCKICDKNNSNKKNEKLRVYLLEMKEFSQTVLGKGLFVSIKGHLCLTKWHLANPEGQLEIKPLSLKVIFDTIDSN